MTLPRSAAQVLSGHVTLEIRCIDRILLTFRQPRLQYGKGIHGFFCHHRGNQFVSSALMLPMTEAFAADIHHYIAARGWSPGIFVDISIMLLLVPDCQIGARNPLGLSCRADVVSGRDCNIARCSRTRRS